MRPEGRNVERVLARLAHRSHGVATRRTMAAGGLTEAEIKHRVASGGLIRVHRGVYRVGHAAPSVEADYLAAVLACGDDALLRGLPAAWLCGLLRGGPPPPEVVASTERRVPGVRVRRSAQTCRLDRWRWRGVPVTSVPRILVDIAADLALDDLAAAAHEAGVRHRTTPCAGGTGARSPSGGPGASRPRARPGPACSRDDERAGAPVPAPAASRRAAAFPTRPTAPRAAAGSTAVGSSRP